MGNLHSVKDNEISLVLHDGVFPTLGHLGDTVGTSSEDGQESDEQRGGKQAELGILDDDRRGESHLPSSCAQAGEVVADQDSKHQQGEHLPHYTSHHEIISQILIGFGIGCRGDTSTSTLEDERKEIASDKDPGVPFRSDAREFGAKGENHMLEGEIDASGEESRSNNETTDLDVKAVAVPRVVVEHHPADIAWQVDEWRILEVKVGDRTYRLLLRGIRRP